MQNGRIKANQLSASSSWDRNHAPNNGRLHLHRVGARMGAWCARHNNRLQWYQVNFGRPTRVVKFAIQGRQDARQWVTQCYLSYSQDGIHYAEFKENSNRKVSVVDYFFHRVEDLNQGLPDFKSSVLNPSATPTPHQALIVQTTSKSSSYKF